MPLGDLDRPDLYVVARFLERLWRDRRPHRKTDLQLAVRLNYTIYKKYLDWLAMKGFVAITVDGEGTERIAITPKGIETYGRLVEWIRETVGDDLL